MAQDPEARILMRAGDTKPSLEVTLTDEDGLPVDLSAATTVEVVVVDWTAAEKWRAPAVVAADATTGDVTYEWRPGDTATAGNYGLYFHVTWDTGDTSDFPTGGPLDFVVAEPGTADLDPFIVPVAKVARIIGIPADNLDKPDATTGYPLREVLEDMLVDVQADVEGYLGRPIVPTRFTESARRDYTDPSGWRLAWDPVVKVITATDNGDGTGTVAYVAGITNPIAQRAIARYVTGAVVEEFRAHPTYGKTFRSVRTLSAGGRSITYDQPAGANRRSSAQLPSFPQPGSMPSVETLARWRKRGVFSRLRWAGPGATEGGWVGSGIYLLGNPDMGVDPLFYGDARTGEVFPR